MMEIYDNKKKFVCVVKVWYDKKNGNTYHNVKLFMNDKILISGITYGYFNQYKETTYSIFNQMESWKEKPFRYPNINVFNGTINYDLIVVGTKKELKLENRSYC